MVRVLVKVLDNLPIYSKDGVRTDCINVVIFWCCKQTVDFALLKIMLNPDVYSSHTVNSLCNLPNVGANSSRSSA